MQDLRARLETISLGEPPARTWLADELLAITGARSATIYRVADDGPGLGLEFCELAGEGPADTRARCARWLRDGRPPWFAFDPRRLDPAQRDRVVTAPAPSVLVSARRVPPWFDRARRRDMQPALDALLRPIEWDLPTTRVLVCDGPSLLAYVGFTTDRRPRADQVAALRALAPVLKRRLVAERSLAEAGATAAALDAALDALPGPALIVSRAGRVRHASATARRWLDAAPDEARAAVARALADERGTRIRLPGGDGYLVVVHGAPLEPATVAQRAAARWGLTPRQRDVVVWLARGATNLRIAGELGCAEATVEVHVTRILARAEVASRAELIARVWQVGAGWG